MYVCVCCQEVNVGPHALMKLWGLTLMEDEVGTSTSILEVREREREKIAQRNTTQRQTVIGQLRQLPCRR